MGCPRLFRADDVRRSAKADLENSPGSSPDPSGLDLGEASQVRAQHVATEGEVHELSLALDLHQSGRLKLLDMVRQCRSANRLVFLEGAARVWIGARPDLTQNSVASWFGQRPRDAFKL